METFDTHSAGCNNLPESLCTAGLPRRSLIPERTVLPLPPALGDETRGEMEIYARFMRHLRQVPNSRMEIKILSAVQFTADMLDLPDAMVAKTLVDLGLRAPRRAFPVGFLDFTDRALQRMAWDRSAAPPSVLDLRQHWDRIGEDRFVCVPRHSYAAFGRSMLTGA